MRAVNIEWDTDGDAAAKASLPSEIALPKGMADWDEISDYISDQTGWLHRGFDVEPDKNIECLAAEAVLEDCEGARLPCSMDWKAYRLRSRDDADDVCLALYGDLAGHGLELLDGAAYPAWALFWRDGDFGGRCEGVLLDFQGRTVRAVQALAARAMELEEALEKKEADA